MRNEAWIYDLISLCHITCMRLCLLVQMKYSHRSFTLLLSVLFDHFCSCPEGTFMAFPFELTVITTEGLLQPCLLRTVFGHSSSNSFLWCLSADCFTVTPGRYAREYIRAPLTAAKNIWSPCLCRTDQIQFRGFDISVPSSHQTCIIVEWNKSISRL